MNISTLHPLLLLLFIWRTDLKAYVSALDNKQALLPIFIWQRLQERQISRYSQSHHTNIHISKDINNYIRYSVCYNLQKERQLTKIKIHSWAIYLHTTVRVQYDVPFLLHKILTDIIWHRVGSKDKPAFGPILPFVALFHHVSLQNTAVW